MSKDKNKQRPCERTIKTEIGFIGPEEINSLASSASEICRIIQKLNSIQEIHALAEAIQDNWARFWESA